jgi:hypothetical protein
LCLAGASAKDAVAEMLNAVTDTREAHMRMLVDIHPWNRSMLG